MITAHLLIKNHLDKIHHNQDKSYDSWAELIDNLFMRYNDWQVIEQDEQKIQLHERDGRIFARVTFTSDLQMLSVMMAGLRCVPNKDIYLNLLQAAMR